MAYKIIRDVDCVYAILSYIYIYIYIYIYEYSVGYKNLIKLTKRPNQFMLKNKNERLTGFGPI